MEEFTAYTVERIKGKKQEEYCDNLCDWYNIYDKEQLKADIEDAYHSQEITN